MLKKANSLFIGKPTISLEHIDSTNVYAAELITSHKPSEGTTIIAKHQTQGLGQLGKTWQAEEGKNITLSIILKPTFLHPTHQFDLTRMVAVAIAQWLEDYIDKQIYIKWPNDIYVGRKKIGGILIQNVLSQGIIQYCILGIGVNVNQARFSSNIPNPTSFFMELNQDFDLPSLCNHMFIYIEQNYLALKNGRLAELNKEYHERLFQRDESQEYILSDRGKISGTIRKVEPLGKLVLEVDGIQKSYSLTEVQHII